MDELHDVQPGDKNEIVGQILIYIERDSHRERESERERERERVIERDTDREIAIALLAYLFSI